MFSGLRPLTSASDQGVVQSMRLGRLSLRIMSPQVKENLRIGRFHMRQNVVPGLVRCVKLMLNKIIFNDIQ